MIDAVLTVVGSCSVYSLDLYLYAIPIEPAFHSAGERAVGGSSTVNCHMFEQRPARRAHRLD